MVAGRVWPGQAVPYPVLLSLWLSGTALARNWAIYSQVDRVGEGKVLKHRHTLRLLPMVILGMMTPITHSQGFSLPGSLLFQGTAAHAAPTVLVDSDSSGSRPAPAAEVPRLAPANAQSLTISQANNYLWRDGGSDRLELYTPSVEPQRPGRRPQETPILPPERQAPGLTPPAVSAPARESIPQDPAEEVAPAVIDLSPTTRFLNPVLSHAMEQQLRGLIGRFESALLMTNSLGGSTTLTLEGTTADLAAADKEQPDASPTPEETAAQEDLPPVLNQAQQLLAAWDDLIAVGRHTEAQERWIQIRQELWEQMPSDQPFAQAEIRAVWLDRGTIVAARSADGLAQVFDQLAAAGINTVFLETVNAGYPIYPSRVAPQQNPLIGPWDPLATAVDLAHERGMSLHAWVWVFAAGNQRHNRIVNLPEDYLGPLLSGQPDWAGLDNRGDPIPAGQDKPFLDPAHPEVRSYLTRLMTEIVTEYDVDGLQLDYIRYPFQDPSANRTYGYGQVARWRFRDATGVDPVNLSPRPDSELTRHQQAQQRLLWDRWTDFRVQQINSFVESLSETLRRQRPDLILSAAVFAKPEHERLQKIQQDWGTWARNGDIDWVVLMSYAEDTSRFEQLVTPWLVEEDLGHALVIPGIRILDLSRLVVMDQLQVTRDLPTPGYALFATADLQTDLTTYLANTQGETPPQPMSTFQMAFNRYQSLQREWVWLLSQDKLWMQREQLTAWVSAANQAEADFQALLATPSRRHLETVQHSLEQVQAPLAGTVLIETVNGRYRVQAWQHRLTAIEQLLHHGKQVEFEDF
jgi:uncharacterized lipoprotein YddW (UPF0748 family)